MNDLSSAERDLIDAAVAGDKEALTRAALLVAQQHIPDAFFDECVMAFRRAILASRGAEEARLVWDKCTRRMFAAGLFDKSILYPNGDFYDRVVEAGKI
jgi:hypothetical protein